MYWPLFFSALLSSVFYAGFEEDNTAWTNYGAQFVTVTRSSYTVTLAPRTAMFQENSQILSATVSSLFKFKIKLNYYIAQLTRAVKMDHTYPTAIPGAR